jgi:putative ABC transport system permease protein
MLRLTLAQMRRSLGRLAAGGIAIAIGTAFVAATLLAGGIMTRTSYDSISAAFADADLVVAAELDDADLATLRAVRGVDAADPQVTMWAELRHDGRRMSLLTLPRASDPRLDPFEVVDGVLPERAGEIAVPAPTAERLGVGLGDELESDVLTWVPAEPGGRSPDDGPGEYVQEDMTFEVTALIADPGDAYLEMGGAAVVTMPDLVTMAGGRLTDVGSGGALVALTSGADLDTVRAQLLDVLDAEEVLTPDEAARRMVGEVANGTDIFTALVLGFAAIALLVAALVIANTFQVLVAQRTRTLALLRCVGALRRQVRRSVLTEAAILGVVASFVGLVAGTALAQTTLFVLRRFDLDVPLPPVVTMTPWVVLAPLALGTGVTVAAALLPARAATRVSPVAALRPAELGDVGGRAGRVRLVLSVLLVVAGASALAGGVVLTQVTNPMLGLAVGVVGGATSFVGVLLGTVFWIPRVVALAGRALGTAPTVRLATANTLRNPRRTAATSTALLIGVTLVAMMSTGAASAGVTLDRELDRRYPVDVSIVSSETVDGRPVDIARSAPGPVSRVDGIAASVALRTSPVRVDVASGGGSGWYDAVGIDAAQAAAVMHDPTAVSSLLEPRAVLVSEEFAADWDLSPGDEVVVTALTSWEEPDDVAPGAEPTTLRVAVVPLDSGEVFVTHATLDALAPDARVTAVWARLAGSADPGATVAAVTDTLSGMSVQVTGSALERARNERLIDTLLAIVVGLLGVAVLIAVIGVANTLSLSVLERRRESATLRAIGLSRRRLRWMLAIEGMLIAGVGAVLGVGLGLLYGWAGSATMLGSIGDVAFAMSWSHLVLVLVVALAAGLLASVLPSRRAARTSPVAALAVD